MVSDESPNDGIAKLFFDAAPLSLEYDALHAIYFPGVFGLFLRKLGLRAEPDWPHQHARLRRLARAMHTVVEQIRVQFEQLRVEGRSPPSEVASVHRAMMAETNCTISLCELVDFMESTGGNSDAGTLPRMAVLNRRYQADRKVLKEIAFQNRNLFR
jgi:hypothetical protein